MNTFRPGFDNGALFGVAGGHLKSGENVHFAGTGAARTLHAEAPPPLTAPAVVVVAPPLPFNIVAGKVYPAQVGGKMPTINGDPLNATTETVPTTGDFEVYFTLNFTVNYTETYLSTWTLNTVTVNHGSSVPSDTASVKYLHFNTVTSGVPVNSFFNSSIGILLGDDGANATRLIYFT